MTTTEKPKSITITVADRKSKRYKSFVVYETDEVDLDEVEKKIKKVLKE